MAVSLFFSCLFCLTLCASFGFVDTETGVECPKMPVGIHEFMNNCIFLREMELFAKIEIRDQAFDECDRLTRATPGLKWRLLKLDSWSKIKNLADGLIYDVSTFWIDLRRESEPANPNEWHDPSKWYWESDRTTLLESFKNEWPPWSTDRDESWCESQLSRTCVLAKWNNSTRSMSWIDWCLHSQKCAQHSNETRLLICESYKIEAKTSPSPTPQGSVSMEPKISISDSEEASTVDGKAQANKGTPAKNSDDSVWPYILLGICCVIAVVATVVIVGFVYRRRRQNRLGVDAGPRKQSPDRKKKAKNRRRHRRRNSNATRSKSRRHLGIPSPVDDDSFSDESLSIFANSQNVDETGPYVNLAPKAKKAPKKKKTTAGKK